MANFFKKYWLLFLLQGFNLFIIFNDNIEFTGDMAMNGLMTYDMQRGNFYSWYFYGTNYFGNLQPFLLSFLTLFTGISKYSLFFWENLAYFLTVLFLIFRLKLQNPLLIFISGLILLFPGRLYYFTFVPMGFAWVTFFAVSLTCFFAWIYESNRLIIPLVHALISAFFLVCIWYNPLILSCAPAYLLLLFYQYKEIIKNFSKYLAFSVLAFLGGMIPFILASKQTNLANIGFFSGSQNVNILNNISFVAKDLILFWTSKVQLENFIKSPVNSLGNDLSVWIYFLAFASTVFVCILGSRFWLKERFLLLTLCFSLAAVVSRFYPKNSSGFSFLRYEIIFFTLAFFFIIFSIKEVYSNYQKVYLKIFAVCSLILVVNFSLQTMLVKYQYAYKGLEVREIVFNELQEKYQVKNLFCLNYWSVCSNLAFYSLETDLKVEITDSDDFKVNVLRNPGAGEKVSEAKLRGERVYSLLSKEFLPKKHLNKIVTEYQIQGTYVLIEGDYRD